MRIEATRWIPGAMGSALLAALLAGPAPAATVEAGIDVWHTPAGGAAIDFGGVDGTTSLDDEAAIPAGFFCAGSTQKTGYITLKGVPIVTSFPENAVGSADTIVRRLDTASVPNGGSAQVRVRIAALSLERSGGALISACGQSWTLRAYLSDQSNQQNGNMTIFKSSSHAGGTFNASFTVKPRFEFEGLTNGAKRSLYPSNALTVSTGSPGDWAPAFCADAVQVTDSFMADTTGDGNPDTWLPGTGNANFGCQCQNGSCSSRNSVAIDHNGPHPETHTDPIEIEFECGAGPGLAVLLPVLLALYERRRRARAA